MSLGTVKPHRQLTADQTPPSHAVGVLGEWQDHSCSRAEMLRGKPLMEKEPTPLAFALQLSGDVPCFPSPEMPLPHPQGDQGGDSLESEGPEPCRAGGRGGTARH